jgi:predicted NAD/FAD-binding protein
MTSEAPLRVCIIGAGASGCAAAWALAQHPSRYDVQVFDPNVVAGGVATSETPDPSLPYINDGVQAAAPSYKNCLRLFTMSGCKPSPIFMKISFNKAADSYWSNYRAETPIVEKLRDEIAKFEDVLKKVIKSEKFYVMWPIRRLLSWNNFSDDFMYKMVFPLAALFFGTGNQTPNVSSVIFARVFLDPELRLFDYDKQRLLHQTPCMYAFDKLQDVYKGLVSEASKNGNVRFNLGCGIVHITRTKEERGGITVVDQKGFHHTFDRLISSCDAETASRLIPDKGFWEGRVLSSVKYFSDVTVTHTDHAYMDKHYNIDTEDPTRGDQYFIKVYDQDKTKVEMSFNLSQYQPQLRAHLAASTPKAGTRRPREADSDAEGSEREPATVSGATNVFQTIFLDANDAAMWTSREISEDKVLMRRWWRQFGHTWRHYLQVVPWVRFAQNTKNTFYAGSWTLVNTHEIATISGLAAAYRLGAGYAFHKDELARQQFQTYLEVAHGTKYEAPDDAPELQPLDLPSSDPFEPSDPVHSALSSNTPSSDESGRGGGDIQVHQHPPNK